MHGMMRLALLGVPGAQGGAASILPLDIDFSTLSDGALPSPLTGTTWAVSGGKAVNTPNTADSIITNGTLEAWTNSTSPTGWGVNASGASSLNQESAEQHGGDYCVRMDVDAAISGVDMGQNVPTVIGAWYRVGYYGKVSAAGKISKCTALGSTVTNGTLAYDESVLTGRATAVLTNVSLARAAGDCSLYIDDVTFKAISLASMFAFLPATASDVRIGVAWEVVSGLQAGVIVNADDTATPSSFVLGYIARQSTGTTAVMLKCVEGTYTQLISAAVTYAAGANVEIRKTGTTYQLFYDDVQVGIDQTVSDAGIVSNNRHGLFSSDGGNSANSFFVTDPALVWTRVGKVLDATLEDEQGHVQEPSVLYEGAPQVLTEESAVFKMWYSGGWDTVRAIFYAESPDGITWTKYESNPVAPNHTRASVFKHADTYIMYAAGPTGLEKVTSPDGITWTVAATNVLQGSEGEWDDGGPANTFVWVEGSTWYMLYEAGNEDGRWQTGLATSTDEGVTWTKHLSNPVFPSATGSTSGPWVTKIGGVYYAWLHGADVGVLPTYINQYRSIDLVNWTVNLANRFPRVLANEGVGAAGGQVADPTLLEVNGTTYMWYTAMADQQPVADINLATSPNTLAQIALA